MNNSHQLIYLFPLITFLFYTLAAVNCDLLLVDKDQDYTRRVIHSEVNPGCPQNLCDGVTVIYTTSDNSSTRDHHFWSHVENEPPSFFMVETVEAAGRFRQNISIDWKKLLSDEPSGSIRMDYVANAIGLSVNRIFFWDDPKSDGYFNETSDQIKVKDFKSSLVNFTHQLDHDNSSSHLTFTFGEDGTNLTVKLRVSTQSVGGRTEQLPQLLLNDRSLNFEVVINGTSSVDYKKNRVGIEFKVAHSGNKFEPVSTASIDDEFSPGVFSEWNLQFKNKVNLSNHIKWKAVGYNKPDRIIAHTVDTILRVNQNETNLPVHKTLDRVMKGFFSDGEYSVTKFNITFQTGEEYYSKSNYTSFSLIMSLGEYIEEEGLSSMVKIIIVTGFGIPVIAIIAAALYLSVKWYRKSAYREIVN